MITLYEMKENKLNSPVKVRYCLYDEVTGYRSLVVSKIFEMLSEAYPEILL